MIDRHLIDKALDEFRIRQDVPGVAVATFDAAGPLETVARGIRSAEDPGGPMRPDTLFRVYSMAKSLTATLIAQLADTGEVDLDEPVAATLPGFRLRGSNCGSQVTLRHLLSHRAGFIPDAVAHEGCSRDAEAIGAAARSEPARTPLVGAPGQVYSYSNLGFIVAGHVAELRTRTPFATLFADRVAGPAGLSRTTHDPAVAMTYPMIQHHARRRGRLGVVHKQRVAAKHAPSSQCWSTVEDMARFGAMHLAGGQAGARRVISQDQIAALHRPHADVRLDVDLRYGLGFYIGPRDRGTARFGHEGFYEGMWCKIICCPATGTGLVWADNRGDELRDDRYRVIDTLLAELGAGPAEWHRTGPAIPAGPAPDGLYERPASNTGLTLNTRQGRLIVSVAGKELSMDPVAQDVWAAASPHTDAPWRSHAGSQRASLGVMRPAHGGEARHVLLNGLPYRRTRATMTRS